MVAPRTTSSHRAGTYVRQGSGNASYNAFVPKPLPPEPPLAMDAETISLISSASLALGKLEGAAQLLPDPDLFVAMYVRKEAVGSSQIEGTQSSLIDLLEFEANVGPGRRYSDVRGVVNYVNAMNAGLERVQTLPVSIRLLREIHIKLLQDTRGGERSPGEVRTSQNWVGAPGATLNEAVYVPPPPHEVVRCLGELEAYLHEKGDLPTIVKCGLVHCQFETIHPFLDGNGRLGRLLVTFLLCHEKVLSRPLLYISAFFKRHQGEYYACLQQVRDNGDWEGWLKFFLRGVRVVAEEATQNIREVLGLRERHRQVLVTAGSRSSHAQALVEYLFRFPVVTTTQVEDALEVSFGTANTLLGFLEENGIIKESTGRKRNRVFVHEPYLTILRRDIEPG